MLSMIYRCHLDDSSDEDSKDATPRAGLGFQSKPKGTSEKPLLKKNEDPTKVKARSPPSSSDESESTSSEKETPVGKCLDHVGKCLFTWYREI
jgi:hypothetical protein